MNQVYEPNEHHVVSVFKRPGFATFRNKNTNSPTPSRAYNYSNGRISFNNSQKRKHTNKNKDVLFFNKNLNPIEIIWAGVIPTGYKNKNGKNHNFPKLIESNQATEFYIQVPNRNFRSKPQVVVQTQPPPKSVKRRTSVRNSGIGNYFGLRELQNGLKKAKEEHAKLFPRVPVSPPVQAPLRVPVPPIQDTRARAPHRVPVPPVQAPRVPVQRARAPVNNGRPRLGKELSSMLIDALNLDKSTKFGPQIGTKSSNGSVYPIEGTDTVIKVMYMDNDSFYHRGGKGDFETEVKIGRLFQGNKSKIGTAIYQSAIVRKKNSVISAYVMDNLITREEQDKGYSVMSLDSYQKKFHKDSCPSPTNPIYKMYTDLLTQFYKKTKGWHGDLHSRNIQIIYNPTTKLILRMTVIDYGSHTPFVGNSNQLTCLDEYIELIKKETKDRIKHGKQFWFNKHLNPNTGRLQLLFPNSKAITKISHLPFYKNAKQMGLTTRGRIPKVNDSTLLLPNKITTNQELRKVVNEITQAIENKKINKSNISRILTLISKNIKLPSNITNNQRMRLFGKLSNEEREKLSNEERKLVNLGKLLSNRQKLFSKLQNMKK